MSNLRGFEEYTPDTAAADEEEAARGNNRFAKLHEGENLLRIMPPKSGKSSPFRPTAQHFLTLPDGKKYVFDCPKFERMGPCPCCDKAQEMDASGNPLDREKARDLFAGRGALCSVVFREEEESGPQVLRLPKRVFGDLSALARSKAGGNFSHPVRGFDVVVKRTGTDINTRYIVMPCRDISPLHVDDDTAQIWLDNSPNLDTLVQIKTFEEIVDTIHKILGRPSGGGAPGRNLPAGRGQPVVQRKPSPPAKAAGRVPEELPDAAEDDLPY